MPVYNSNPARFQLALEGILGQSFGDFELFISDNGSGDEARQLYENAVKLDSRVRYSRHERNYGAGLNFTYAFTNTSGEYFMWAADDDVRGKDYLARTVERLDRDATAVSAGTDTILVDDNGNRVGKVSFSESFELPTPHQRIPVHGFVSEGDYFDIYSLHRRPALLRTHIAAPMHGADCLLVRELLLQGKIVRTHEELFFYRVPMSYSMSGLAVAAYGEQALPFLFRHPHTYLALQMVIAVLTNDIPISEVERTRCVVALASSLVLHGWLTRDPNFRTRAEAKEAWGRGDFVRVAMLMAKSFALAPKAALDPSAWRRLIGRLTPGS